MAAKFIGAEDLESNEEPRVVVSRSRHRDPMMMLQRAIGVKVCNFVDFLGEKIQILAVFFFFFQKNTIDVLEVGLVFFARTQGFFCGRMKMGLNRVTFILGGGLKYFLFSTRTFGEMIQFDGCIFFRWVGKNHHERDLMSSTSLSSAPVMVTSCCGWADVVSVSLRG